MKPRYLFLAASVAVCAASIAIIMMKGNPQDRVDLDSVSEIGEGILHSVNKVGSIVTSVSDNDEMEIGDKINARMMNSRLARSVDKSPMGRYVNEVGDTVARNVNRNDIKYRFHIIKSPFPDAFSSPGGHVYITTALLKALKTESELASVLAHEVVHIDAKHCIGALQYTMKTEKILGPTLETFADIGYDLLMRPGFSETQETEADAGSVYLIYKAGYHPLAMAYAFERVDKELAKKGYENSSQTPIGDTLMAAAGMVGRYFNTHPAAMDRIDKIKKYVSEHNLIEADSRFYIGEENYRLKIPFEKKRFREEFKRDYALKEDK